MENFTRRSWLAHVRQTGKVSGHHETTENKTYQIKVFVLGCWHIVKHLCMTRLSCERTKQDKSVRGGGDKKWKKNLWFLVLKYSSGQSKVQYESDPDICSSLFWWGITIRQWEGVGSGWEMTNSCKPLFSLR